MRVFDIGAKDGPQQVSDRFLTVPNLLSFARMAVLPLIYVDLTNGRWGRALVLVIVFASTDWFDGYLARRLDQTSRLGQLLDPVSDRLLFLVVGVGFVVADLLPLVALALLLVRDAVVMGIGAVLLGLGRRPPPVSKVGKTATFGLMVAFPLFLLAAVLGQGAAEGRAGFEPQPVVQAIAWVTFAVNAVLYYVSAAGYARVVLRERRLGSRPSPPTGE